VDSVAALAAVVAGRRAGRHHEWRGVAVVDRGGARRSGWRSPVLAVTRHDTADSELADALRAAGLKDRLAILERTPPAEPMGRGLYVAWAGADAFEARQLVQATLNKSRLPEPLRIAHLIGAALVRGQSRGRV